MSGTVSTEQGKTDSHEIIQIVSFRLGEEEYGVDILNVQEIIKMLDITRVPNSPDFVEGVINLRGKVLPVIDLRKRLGLPKKEHDKSTRIIVVEMDHKTVGFIVDSVSEVLRIPSSSLEAPPQMSNGVGEEFINAVGKLQDRLLILLDLRRILSVDEKQKLEMDDFVE